MTKNTFYFFFAFLLSLPFFMGINTVSSTVEDTYFLAELSKNPEVLTAATANAALQSSFFEEQPFRDTSVPLTEVFANAAFSLYVNGQGNTNVLFAKNQHEALPIASLTKLMTALVVEKYYPPEELITVTKEAIQKEENTGNFRAGEQFLVKDLLHSLLIESSNDAAAAFALYWGRDTFLHAMNEEAEKLSLEHTSFVDEAGVDPNEGEFINRATAKDLAELSRFVLENHPEVFSLLSMTSAELKTADGKLHHTVRTTNDLLISNGWETKVLGGKTGWTPKANGCLLLILESPDKKGYLVNVVLGADDRFAEMKTMVNWVLDAYEWKQP
ncbi:MAG: serine hydrolase [bacterium]|nr:serine hydrolase [bacterium]